MHPMPIDKVLMALSILLATPENYIQLNSKRVDISKLQREGLDRNILGNCGVQEMRNLTADMDMIIHNQIQIEKRIYSIFLDLNAIKSRLSAIGCAKKQVGEVLMKVSRIPVTFFVWCVSNQFGDNWLLVAKRNVDGKLFLQKSTETEEDSIGEFEDEYFIGFEKLKAITDSQLCELLIVEMEIKGKKQWYDHYQYVAFGEDNKVKLLGEHKTNRLNKPISLLAHAQAVNEKLKLKTNSDVTVYLRRTALGATS